MHAACFGQSCKWSDEETEQIEVPKSFREEMDLSDCWRGRWSMQLQSTCKQNEPKERWNRGLEQCVTESYAKEYSK